ncbi:hypothetical protein A6V37_37715 [Paraburkholderia ginsengiterrae]|uniref:Uncharacterized protein n=1 Tax=Paraburkholderia ginsengiterrae TaxID=1462993 RepID=A0A1A9NF11_9BURK|nr:hypothetical protein A6V37_37715 [Paraburkholderia ginsengiterrae]
MSERTRRATGGGCERVVRSGERVEEDKGYIGVGEVGGGLVPAGGGLRETAGRAGEGARQGVSAAAGQGAGSGALSASVRATPSLGGGRRGGR